MTQQLALGRAGGLAAEAILERLHESGFAPDSLVLLDQPARVGARLPYGNGYLPVVDETEFDFGDCALLLLPEKAPELVDAATGQGCLVLSHALEPALPALFVDPSEAEPLLDYTADRFRLVGPELACLLPVLTTLDRRFGIEALNLVLLRSAEFEGKAGVDELAAQTVDLLNAREARSGVFPSQIAFNLLPMAADPVLAADLRRYLVNSSYTAMQQSVNVPVFHGFVAAVQLRLGSDCEREAAERCLGGLEGLVLKPGLASPIDDCNRSSGCVLSQLESIPDQPMDLQFWLLADPLRYGLANNYVNVADFLLKSFL